MAKNKIKTFEDKFTYDELKSKLDGFTASSGYSFTKRNNPNQFNKILELVPEGYANDRYDDLEMIEFIYSGSEGKPFLLTIAAGRNDRFRGSEKLDVDVFNIAPNTGNTMSYFENQFHHFSNEEGERVSLHIASYSIADEDLRKDTTYATLLTGSISYYSLEDYEREKSQFFEIHKQSFKNID